MATLDDFGLPPAPRLEDEEEELGLPPAPVSAQTLLDEDDGGLPPAPAPFTVPSQAEARETVALPETSPEEIEPVVETPVVDIAPAGFESAVPATPAAPLIERPDPTELQVSAARIQLMGNQADRIANDLDQATRRLDELRSQYDAAPDDAKRAEILAAMQPVAQAREAALAQQRENRIKLDDESDRAAVELQRVEADLTADAQRDAAARLKGAREEAARLMAAREMEEQAARAQLEKDTEAYRKSLKVGAPADAQSITEIISESFRAGLEKRFPDYGRILDRALQRTAQQRESRVRAASERMRLAGDDLDRQAQMRAEAQAQARAQEAAIIQEAEAMLAEQLRIETQPLRQAQLAAQLDGVRREREARDAAAAQARLDADRKTRKMEAEIGREEAGARKETALARKAEAEAAKLEARLGVTGRRMAQPEGLIAPNVVTLPDSDTPLVTFANNAEGKKEAAATRLIIGKQAKALDRINTVISLYEDAETAGWLDSAGWERTGEYENLQKELAFLRTDLALVKSDGLATTGSDDDWAKTLVPEKPKAWSSREKAEASLQALRRVIENETRNQLGSKTRLDKATRERVIAASRPKSTSQKDVEKREKAQAEQDLISPTTSSQRKVIAVDQVEALAREEAASLGNEDDWLPLATSKLADALSSPAVANDPEARKAIRKKMDFYEKAAEERRVKGLSLAHGRALRGAGAEPDPQQAIEMERAERIRRKSARAKTKDVLRDMPDEALDAFKAIPGMGDIVIEVQAEKPPTIPEPEEDLTKPGQESPRKKRRGKRRSKPKGQADGG